MNMRLRHNIITYLTPFQMYRLTVRTSKDTVSQHICQILGEQF